MCRSMIAAVAVLLLAAPPALAIEPPPALQWARTFVVAKGGRGYSCVLAPDGDVVAAGYSYAPTSQGNRPDYFLVKIDTAGNVLWKRLLGAGEYNSQCRSVWATSDGGYILSGSRTSTLNGTCEPYLVKVNAEGLAQWDKAWTRDSVEFAFSVRQATDGGYIVGGIDPQSRDSTGIYVVKTDSLGNRQWFRVFRQSFNRALWGKEEVPVLQALDGDFLVGMRRDSLGLWLIKLDQSGNVVWDRTYLYISEMGVGGANCVQQTSDGGFIVTGAGLSVSEPSNHGKVYLLKTDSAGNMQWCRLYGGGYVSEGFWVEQTSDHGYVVAGIHQLPGASCNGYIVRTDSVGNQRWTYTYAGSGYDDFRCIKQTPEGGYVAVGSSQVPRHHLLVVKLAAESKRRK